MGGGGPVVDSTGNLVFTTGNGPADGVTTFGDSFLKLSPSLSVVDWFTPANNPFLNLNDVDLGSSHPVAFGSFIVGGGKEGTVYFLNEGNLGHETAGDAGALQTFGVGSGIYSAPVFFNNTLYVSTGTIKAFAFNGSLFTTTPSSESAAWPASSYGPSLFASGNGTVDGILWAAGPSATNNFGGGLGVLTAYNASNLAQVLWTSDQNAGRDALGFWSMWSPPVVANGKLYAGTLQNTIAGAPAALVAYGPISTTGTGPSAQFEGPRSPPSEAGKASIATSSPW